MANFYTVLTETGQAKMANAIALGTTIEITALAVGDGGGALPQPDSNRTTLVNETRRAPINRVEVDADNPSWLIVEQVLPPDVGGWTIREVGIFDTDGDLIGYGNYPETYKPTLDQGSGRTLTIRMVLEVSHTAAVTLKVDPSVVLATREYVDDQRAEHEQSRNHPAATETAQGMAQIADQPTVDTGENDSKFITPKKLKSWATAWVKQATEAIAGMLKVATQEQVDAGTDDTAAVTPKKLRWGVSYAIGGNGYIILPSWLGGLIIQWMQQSMGYNIGFVNFPLPIPFPNTVYSAACLDIGTAESTLVAWKANFPDNASMNIRWNSVAGSESGSKLAYIILLGK